MKRFFVQANPGFFTAESLRTWKDGKAVRAYPTLDPIVAWQIDTDPDDEDSIAVTTPVTTSGTDTGNPIVYPDGRVVLVEAYAFASVEEWVDWLNEEESLRLDSLQ